VANLIQLEEQLLAHDLQRADLSRVLLLGQEHLAIATLADLREYLEVGMPKANATFAQVSPLSACILVPHLIVRLLIGPGRRGELRLEGLEPVLSVSHISQEVEVVIEKV